MDLRVNQNLAANIALGGLRSATSQFNAVSERLATGLRVNRAADSMHLFTGQTALRKQLSGISAAQQNTLVASNHLSVAQDGLASILDGLNKLRGIALKSLGPDPTNTNGTVTQKEVDLILDRIDAIANDTSVGGNKILNGTGDFQVQSTDNAFDKIHIHNAKFGSQEASRTVDMEVTQAAARATTITNLDMASLQVADHNTAYVNVAGREGTRSVHVTESTSSDALVDMINEAAGATGVYASSHITSVTETGVETFDLAAGDLTLTGGDTFTMVVDGVQVTGTATEDIGGGDFRIRNSDLQRALNDASQGSFSVFGGTDAGANERNMIIRRAGNTAFNITGFASADGTVSGALAGTTITGNSEPAASRMISDGANLAGAQSFGLQLFQNGHVVDRTINIASVDEAGFDAGLSGIADSTYLGVGENGQDIFLFEATGDTDAFRFMESSSTDTTAHDLGLLSHSGGGNGLATQGMGVLALYSKDFGGDKRVSLNVVGDDGVNFGRLNVAASNNSNLGVGAKLTSLGENAKVRIDGRTFEGTGFDFNVSVNGLDFAFDLSQRFGAGSYTNALNRIANINQTTAEDDFLIGFRPITEQYAEGRGSGQLYSQGDLDTLLNGGTPSNYLFANDRSEGVIDNVSFTVSRNLFEKGGPRSGLAVQLNGEQGGREYLGIQSFDTSFLGAGPQEETGIGSVGSDLAEAPETISQLRTEGRYNFINASPQEVNQALAIIERSIDEVIKTQTRLGTYQVQTLDRNRDWLASMESSIAQSLADVESNDVVKDITAFSTAQVRVNAATSVLAQANTIPQTLLTLLR